MAPMTDAKQAWEEVGSKFSGLGQRLKQHLDAERDDDDQEEVKAQANRDVKAALERLTDAIDDAFDALGNAAKDPAVREDVSDAGRSLVGALGTSLEQLGEEVRRLMDRKKQRGPAGTGDAGAAGGEPSGAGTAASEPPLPGSLNDTPEDGGPAV